MHFYSEKFLVLVNGTRVVFSKILEDEARKLSCPFFCDGNENS